MSDFLDEMVAERTERNPDFPHLLDTARRPAVKLIIVGSPKDESDDALALALVRILERKYPGMRWLVEEKPR